MTFYWKDNFLPFASLVVKVGIFWEGHKIWKNLPLQIWRYWVASNFKWKIFWNFVPTSESLNFNNKKRSLHNLCWDWCKSVEEDWKQYQLKLPTRKNSALKSLVWNSITWIICRYKGTPYWTSNTTTWYGIGQPTSSTFLDHWFWQK